MPLTSRRLLALIALAFLLVLVATLRYWHRMPGRRATRFGLRLGLLLGNQILAVLLVGALVNDSGGFYTSWAQLFGHSARGKLVARIAEHPVMPIQGALPGAAPSTADPLAARNGRVTVGTDPTWAGPAQWPTRGRLESVTITGGASQLSSRAYVYLPPQYFQPRYAHTLFPAFEILTGYPGRDTDLIHGLRVPTAMLNLIDTHAAAPAVLVMTRPAVTYPRNTECTDVPAGPQAETFFATDVPLAISNAYRVRQNAWGAAGVSTGGYCAVKLAMLHPEQFYAAVSISGYYTPVRDTTTGDLWGGSAMLRNLNDLDWRLQHLSRPPVSVLTTVGSGEPSGNVAQMKRFDSLVRAPMRVSAAVVPGGGQDIASFAREFPAALGWLSKRVPPV